ncbi:hypothetical protein JG688_00017980 [Phytophthora aleatoria]|uniref:ATP-dependent DNA helicase n=1 Tax=Phytophthora aleatoria TaxID=2496075 RepID=A0A8J5I060_9STRA|nr:hypothetical protein JG688_00017980 [Phytophthora aleatoria]
MKQRAGDAIVEVELVIIDEVSMMKKFQLSQLDTSLRAAKRMPDVEFGGVHIVLVGDFLQLPPVSGQPLYADPTISRISFMATIFRCNHAEGEYSISRRP